MSTKKKDEDTLTKFFNISSPDIQDLIATGEQSVSIKGKRPIAIAHPTLTNVKPAEENELKENWKELQSFFRNPEKRLKTKRKIKDLYPVLLSAYRNNEYVGKDFPIWVGTDVQSNKENCMTLENVLHQTIDVFAPEVNQATILKENVDRIVAHCSTILGKINESQKALPIVLDAVKKLKSKLSIKGEEAKVFDESLEQLKTSFPEHGYLIHFSEKTVYEMLHRIVSENKASKSVDQLNRANKAKAKLLDLLAVEKEKGSGDQLTSSLKSSLGFADSLIDFNEMSSVNPESGSKLMPENRLVRIKKIIESISHGESLFEHNATILFHKELYSDNHLKLEDLFDHSEVKEFFDRNGCEEAMKSFNENIKGFEAFIAAIRMAELEVLGQYDEEIHDEYFSHFKWRLFSDEEMESFPPIILVSESETLLTNELASFSKLMSHNIPVKILALRRESLEDFKKNGTAETDKFVFRQELAAIAVAHRNTYILQSATISPQYLFQGLKAGLNHFSPTLFNVLCPSDVSFKSPFMWGSAAVESRDFPGFRYNGNLTELWGSRFDVDNNPQVENPWPLHDVKITNTDGEEEVWNLPFTYADFCFIKKSYSSHFQVVERKYWNDKLILLADYLSFSDEDIPGKVPFIWVVDGNNELQKVAVSFSLVLACKERLDFWDYLQENGGIHNYHVDEAIQKERVNLKAESEQEIAKAKEEFNDEIERVKKETAGEAMERLTNFLLNMDEIPSTSTIAISPKKESDAVEETAEKENLEGPDEAEQPQEDEVISAEPWIETPLCTSCNECTDINDQMFSYNADKMAYIADPKAGTFAELVAAAELCPAEIIHPGSPLNPNEPDLDDLVKRAEQFN